MESEHIEEWRDVVGFEGRYQVSNLGKVRSLDGASKHHRGMQIVPKTTSCYSEVSLYFGDGRRKSRTVHKLVAEAFIGPCPDGFQVNHKNGNHYDPRLENLEYVTASENALHAFRVIKTRVCPVKANPECAARGDRNGSRLHPDSRPKGEGHANATLTVTNVLAIREKYANGALQVDLAKEFGIAQGTVSYIVLRKGWKHI